MGWLTVAGSREGDRTECGHREEVVESTISLPLHTVGTWGAPTEAGEREGKKRRKKTLIESNTSILFMAKTLPPRSFSRSRRSTFSRDLDVWLCHSPFFNL